MGEFGWGITAVGWELLHGGLMASFHSGPFASLADPDFFDREERDEWGHGISWPGELMVLVRP